MMRSLVVSLLVVGLAGPAGCSRSVGLNPGDDATVNNNNGSGSDATVTQHDGQVVHPDAGGLIQEVGWRLEAFEHSAFIPEDVVDLDALAQCQPYTMAESGHETWWAYGDGNGALLQWARPSGGLGVGLLSTQGYLSEPGVYGHDGGYQREYDIVTHELQLCPTVDVLRDCVLPRAGDYCQFPEPEHTVRENYLARILPGPATDMDHYELSVTYNPEVADGMTKFAVDFALPLPTDPNATWELFEVTDADYLTITEIRSWFYYQEIPYPNDLTGWIVRDLLTDSLSIALSARSDGNETVFLWGHFPVDEELYYP